MMQDEELLKSQVMNIKDAIVRKEDSIKRLEKCIKVGKQEGITEVELLPFGKKILELKDDKKRLNGELNNIYHKCEHEFEIVGTIKTLFGEENVYKCTKCDYKIMF